MKFIKQIRKLNYLKLPKITLKYKHFINEYIFTKEKLLIKIKFQAFQRNVTHSEIFHTDVIRDKILRYAAFQQFSAVTLQII